MSISENKDTNNSDHEVYQQPGNPYSYLYPSPTPLLTNLNL